MIKKDNMKTYKNPDENGYYGEFGGAFVPEMLYRNVEELQNNYLEIINSEEFQEEYQDLLKNYVGRATPLYFAKNLSKKYQTQVYLKREDLNHTGAHKINNALGQALLAKKLGKRELLQKPALANMVLQQRLPVHYLVWNALFTWAKLTLLGKHQMLDA